MKKRKTGRMEKERLVKWKKMTGRMKKKDW